MIEQAKFTYFPLGKAFEKQKKLVKIKEKNKKKQLKKIKNNYIVNNQVIMNYCFQRKEKYL